MRLGDWIMLVGMLMVAGACGLWDYRLGIGVGGVEAIVLAVLVQAAQDAPGGRDAE